MRPDPDALIERDVTALTRAAITRAQAYVAKRSRSDELAMARERWGDDPMVPLVLRAATTPTGLPHALGQSIVADLLTVVGPTGAGARLLQLGLSLTFGEHATIYVPDLEVTASQTSFSGQMAPIPARQLLTTSVTLAPSKLTSIVPVTVEMLESSNIELIVSNALSRAVGLTLDGALFDSLPADSTRPAGLRHNIVAIAASANPYVREAMVADMAALAGAVAEIGGSIAYIAAPARAAMINLWASRELPYPVLSSPAVAAADLICVATDGLVSAVDAAPEIDTSNVAVLHIDDAPLPISTPGTPPTVAAPTHSLWQSGMVGIRLRFGVSWALRSPKALAWLVATKW